MSPAAISFIVCLSLLIIVVVLIWAMSPPDGDGDDDAGGGGGGPKRRPLPRPRGPHDALAPPSPERIRVSVAGQRRRLPARDATLHR